MQQICFTSADQQEIGCIHAVLKTKPKPNSSLTSSTGVGNPKELLEGPHEREHFFDQLKTKKTERESNRKREREGRVEGGRERENWSKK